MKNFIFLIIIVFVIISIDIIFVISIYTHNYIRIDDTTYMIIMIILGIFGSISVSFCGKLFVEMLFNKWRDEINKEINEEVKLLIK